MYTRFRNRTRILHAFDMEQSGNQEKAIPLGDSINHLGAKAG